MTTFLFMILFVIMVILYVKEKNVSVSKWYGGYDINYGKRLKPRYIFRPDDNFKDCAGVQAAQINPKILSSEDFYQ